MRTERQSVTFGDETLNLFLKRYFMLIDVLIN